MAREWQIGDRIADRYEVRDVKTGGMGIVFLCFDCQAGDAVALKTLLPRYLDDRGANDRFLHEAKVWVDLGRHPNIVFAEFVQTIEERAVVFMECITGPPGYGASLRGWIEQHRLTPQRALSIAIQACDGLLHATGVFQADGRVFVHRDLKPENILLSSPEAAKVADFGLVRLAPGGDGRPLEEMEGASRLTREGAVLGTPGYMAPEQWAPNPRADARVDVYALGCILHEMLTSRPVFAAQTLRALAEQHQHAAPPHIPGAPKEVDQLVHACLAKQPESRPASVQELRHALAGVYLALAGREHPTPHSSALTRNGLLNRSASLLALRYPREAVEICDRLLAAEPQLAAAWVNRGAGLVAGGDVESGLISLEEAVRCDPENWQAWANRGLALLELRRPKAALESLDRALGIEPGSAELRGLRGFALLESGRHEEARTELSGSLTIDPHNSRALTYMGALEFRRGNHEEALAFLARALDCGALNTDAWRFMSIALSALGRNTKALACIEHGLLLAPDDAEMLTNKAKMLLDSGDPAAALACSERATRVRPKFAEGWRTRGDSLSRLGREAEALDCYDQALATMGDRADAGDSRPERLR